ncbi:SURF1 family protein [Robbsia sp. Bb-Pol-6]|uniref:SURF1-like protein n=1 Tax=Robbsia betulipollinis TaxID=2981849 RepID=A0ABT3ZKU1_9BURK|nr:SURF1 family protein [Robbsia betulipollinis]MCY0387158.1 SURF1 family protein [Robbsia betulipollinis]
MRRPRIRVWPAAALVAVMAVTIALGFWQRDRAHQKETRQRAIVAYAHMPARRLGAERVSLAAIAYHRVVLRGHFLADRVVYLDNRSHQDRPGFHVLMPFAVTGGAPVLVNRGWLPRDPAERTRIAPYRTSPGEIEITGLARADAGRTLMLAGQTHEAGQRIRQNLDVVAYARETGLALQPFVLVQDGDGTAGADGLLRDWPPATADVARNYGYMLQWWGMAAAALGFGLYLAFRREAPAGGPDAARGAGPAGAHETLERNDSEP